ncbi:MAG: hypothetical protein LUC30_02770 [Clostridiales bacterium]|nr:hypothetical protein [Clostridiales bacterium]
MGKHNHPLDFDTDELLFLMYEMDEDQKRGSACYIATCVYGSYDCPQVWTLRRFRDGKLARTVPGRWFIRLYYAVSPRLVSAFGEKEGFRRFWRKRLDRLVARLKSEGVPDTPYRDTEPR